MLIKFFLFLVIFFSFFSFAPALAQNTDMLGTEIGVYAGLTKADPRLMVASIIRGVMGLMGLGALVIFLYSGFEWMTSMGNEEKVKDAKKRILYTVIGMAILLSAYAITMFVFKTVYLSTGARFYN